MIYHYCSLDGLLGILRYKCVWVSNYRFLNDYQEIDVGIGLIANGFNDIRRKISSVKKPEEVLDKLKKSLNKTKNIFVASFSKDVDLLSQWRAYANNGRGVCIGFDENSLKNLGYPVVDVTYKKSELINAVCELLMKCSKSNNWDNFELKLNLILASYKTKDFREENEKRIIILPDYVKHTLNMSFRVSGNFVVPYFALDFTSQVPDIIKEIWIGPLQKDRDVKASIKYFVDIEDYTNTRIKSSKAPYR